MNTITRSRRLAALRDFPDFRQLWGAHLISALGTGVTTLAIPLLAAVLLHASPVEIGVLTALNAVPHVVFSLVAGALIDRSPQRAVLVVTDFGRACCLGAVPVLGLLHLLSMQVLYGVVVLVQTQTVVNDLASASLVPKVLPTEMLAAGNSALSVNSSVAGIAGNGLGGGLVQLAGASLAVAVDAVSYAVSGTLLLFLRSPSLRTARVRGRRGIVGDIKSGLAYVRQDRVLVALCLTSGIGALAVAIRDASLVLALVRDLHFSPALVGLLAMLAGLGGVIGGLLASRVAKRLGFGRSVLWAIVVSAPAIGLLTSPFGVAAPLVVGLGQFIAGASGAVYTIGQLTMRQLVTPPDMLGRVNAVRRFLVYAMLPVGGLVGGFGGVHVGSRAMLGVAAVVMLASVLPLLAADVRPGARP